MIRIRITSYRLFYFFCGVAYPCIAFGAVYLTARANLLFGVVTAMLLTAWTVNSFATTCRRCQFYGTSKCGLPGLIVPFFFARRSPSGLPNRRIWVNYYLDLALMVYLNLTYLLRPWLAPLVVLATCIVWAVIYRPKRFHGLMHRLRDRTSQRPLAA